MQHRNSGRVTFQQLNVLPMFQERKRRCEPNSESSLPPSLSVCCSPPSGARRSRRTVNVNTATAAEFQLLPRIGPSVAARIVEHREKNGAFKSLDDLMLVRGIGESTYEQLKPYLALAGATTLNEKVKLPRAPKAPKQADKPAAKS